MMIRHCFFAAFSALALGSCGGGGDGTPTPTPVSSPTPPPVISTDVLGTAASTPPFALSNANALFYADIAYGTQERQQLDLFLPRSGSASGLVIFYHGGGFRAGDKAQEYDQPGFRNFINTLLDRGIAFASANYRYIDSPASSGVETSLADGRRSLQFLRANSNELSIDPQDVVLAGGSAGAGIALHMALTDDLADAAASDPVLRQSTRVKAAYGAVPQASYDVPNWDQTIFANFQSQGFDFDSVLAILGEQYALDFYGISDLSELESQRVVELRQQLDFIAQLTSDDPELYLESDLPDSLPEDFDLLVHHPRHIAILSDRANASARPIRARAPGIGLDSTGGENVLDFVQRHLAQ